MSVRSTPRAAGVSLGSELERVRLEERARQLERVVRVLRSRARAADAAHRQRGGLQRAVADFTDELEGVRRRLEGHPIDA